MMTVVMGRVRRGGNRLTQRLKMMMMMMTERSYHDSDGGQ